MFYTVINLAYGDDIWSIKYLFLNIHYLYKRSQSRFDCEMKMSLIQRAWNFSFQSEQQKNKM